MTTPSQLHHGLGHDHRKVERAEVLVAHAGMGSVISALTARRPIVILPRRPELSEVTTAHQLATARWLAEKPGVFVADEETLERQIELAISSGRSAQALADAAPREFLSALRSLVLGFTRT
jgi:UDP-N-acetylglucosamine transferase subunit ALG13